MTKEEIELSKVKIEYITINGKQYSKDSPFIAQDCFTGKWIEINNAYKLARSIYLTKTGGFKLVKEWVYTRDVDKYNSRDYTYKLLTDQGTWKLPKNYEITGTGNVYSSVNPEDANYILYDDITNKKMNKSNKFRTFDNHVSAFRDYDNPNISFSEKKEILERDILFGVRSMTNKIFEGLDYTFGVELETSSGRLTVEDAKDLNLKCEFDGSLREFPEQKKEDVLGGEYVTGVLTGDAGMHQLQKICNILSEKCTIGPKCGVHTHVGNINFTKDVIVYLYILGELLQDEIFSILPASRRTNSYCRKLKKLGLYSKELDNRTTIMYNVLIDEYYRLIFKDVYSTEPSKKYNKLHNHPQGAKCGYNKDSQRYSWLNFVPAMCNTRDNIKAFTIEFRPMYATLNYMKVKNWVKICIAFVNFAENHQASIKRGYWIDPCSQKHSINLATIIKAAYPRTGRVLEEYVEEKKNYFLLDNGNIELFEYKKDKEGVRNLNKLECVL